MTQVLRAVNAAVIVCAAVALYRTARFGVADWLSTSTSEADALRSVSLVPGNATAWLHLADLRSVGDGDTTEPLRRALEASPQDSHIWVQLGLDMEGKGQYPEAERCLLRAVELDRDFIPIWTLTNFYFRRGDQAHFFPAVRRTLGFARGDLSPLFRMCWSITDDGERILREAIPDRADTLPAYLEWLDAQNLLDAGQPVAKRLLQRFPRQGATALLEYCDRLIAAQRLDSAVALWNQMNQRGAIRAGPAAPGSMVNGQFRAEPVNGGFDWRLGSPSGIEVASGNGGLNVSFSGSEPDHCDIAAELVLLAPGRTWRLGYGFQASGLEAGAGVHWTAADARSGERFSPPLSQFTLTPRDLTSSPSGAGEFSFVVPANEQDSLRLTRLALVYDRQPGSAPMQGWIRVDKVWLEEAK